MCAGVETVAAASASGRQRDAGDQFDLVARYQFGRFLAHDIRLPLRVAAQEHDLAPCNRVAVLLHPDLDGSVGLLTERRCATGIGTKKADLERRRFIRPSRPARDQQRQPNGHDAPTPAFFVDGKETA